MKHLPNNFKEVTSKMVLDGGRDKSRPYNITIRNPKSAIRNPPVGRRLPNNFKMKLPQRWFPTDSEAAPASIRNPQSAIRNPQSEIKKIRNQENPKSAIRNPPGGRRLLYALLCAVFCVSAANAADSLLYFEAQGVAGYSSMDDAATYHSGHIHDAMQKNGIGFDYIRKFSSEYGDFGSGALQMRLVWNDADDTPQVQVYNAYFKLKTLPGDVWAGHNRVPFGLSAYWDTHADLLQPLSMYGFGFERDWGAGISRDFANGDFSAAITTGSGMALKTNGNLVAAARASYGVLSRDNYNVGASFLVGKTLDTMGYEVMDDDPKDTLLGGVDFAWNHDRVEHKAEFDLGRKNEMAAAAVFYRIGYNLLEENRLKLEGQYAWTKREGVSADMPSFGVTYKISSDLTARAMYQRDRKMNDDRVVFQLYYYRLWQ